MGGRLRNGVPPDPAVERTAKNNTGGLGVIQLLIAAANITLGIYLAYIAAFAATNGDTGGAIAFLLLSYINIVLGLRNLI